MKKAKASFFPALACLCGLVSMAGKAAPPQDLRPVPNQRLTTDPAKERGSLPDLTVTLNPRSLQKPTVTGESVLSRVQATINNIGTAAANNIRVAVLLSTGPSIVFDPSPHASLATGRIIGQASLGKPLLPHASAEPAFQETWDTKGLAWGEYYVTVMVDPTKLVAESNETNNSVQAGIFRQAFVQYIDMSCINGPILDFHGKGFGSWKSSVTARVGSHTFVVPKSDEWTDEHVHVHVPPGLLPLTAQDYVCHLFHGAKILAGGHDTVLWGIFLWHADPQEGPPGTSVHLTGCNFQSAQGTKKLQLWKGTQFIADVPVTSWSEELIVAVIPNAPPDQYKIRIYDQGVQLTIIDGKIFTIQ